MSQKTDRVIAEILQKRDRFTKNFRTENHGGAAVIYGYPVHYKEGEEWKEIDNRLEKNRKRLSEPCIPGKSPFCGKQ